MSKHRVFLLDGHALAYRAHFAFIKARLQNAEGIPTGPLLGFANTIVRLIDSENPTHLAVAWDTHAPTFRHEMDENYKANRPPQPDELRVTIPLMKEMIEKFGFKNLEKDGFEADDIIGTLALKAGREGADVFMVTPDKDFMQLVTDKVKMYKPMNNGDGFNVIDVSGVEEYFGVPPEKVVDVLAIIGDTSDNIPGVPGIGKKGAPDIIKEFGSLEAAIEAAPGMPSKRAREGLMNNSEQALISKKMVIIDTDVPDTVDWKELEWKGPDKQSLSGFFKRMEFRTLTRKFSDGIETVEDHSVRSKPKNPAQGDLFGTGHAAASIPDHIKTIEQGDADYTPITDENGLKKLADKLKKAKHLCIDTETTDVDALIAELVGIAISVKENEAWFIRIDETGQNGITIKKTRDCLNDVFGSDSLKIAHNYKYDYMVLYRHGFALNGPVFDTMIAAYLIDSNQKLGMDELSKRYLEYRPISIDKLIGSGKKQKSMKDVPLEELYPYACEDADITLRLYHLFDEKLRNDGLAETGKKIDFPLINVLAHMEMAGIKVDTEMLGAFSKELAGDIREAEREIYKEAGGEFNVNSPAQLGTILFDKLGLPPGRKTKSGNYSTDEQVLTDLSVNYRLPALILDYRSLAKLKSTYVDAIPKLMNPETGRIHTSFNQQVAATGRLSSSNPNLQNIPIRTQRGREIRKAFVAEKGFKLLSADYSQIELRVIASMAGDEAMITAFNNGEDIHARTAKEIFGLQTLGEVDREMRRKAKEVNFGIPYGVSAFGLAQRLGISRTEAKTIIDAYFDRFKSIRTYINKTVQFAAEHGYVTTLFGRRRYIPDIRSSNPSQRGFAERTAINMPIQGTAADLIKIAMVNVHNALMENGLKTKMVLQVHDELLFEVPENELEQVMGLVREHMENAVKLNVPVKVEMGYGANWLDAH